MSGNLCENLPIIIIMMIKLLLTLLLSIDYRTGIVDYESA